MRKLALLGTTVLALSLALTACSSEPEMTGGNESSMSQGQEESMTTDLTGTFAGLNDKAVEGTVTISGDEIVLSGFSSDEGPDLHLYLTNGTDEAAVAAGTELGIVAFDEDSQTFTIDGVDAADFTDIVVHCDKAKAVFGAANLS